MCQPFFLPFHKKSQCVTAVAVGLLEDMEAIEASAMEYESVELLHNPIAIFGKRVVPAWKELLQMVWERTEEGMHPQSPLTRPVTMICNAIETGNRVAKQCQHKDLKVWVHTEAYKEALSDCSRKLATGLKLIMRTGILDLDVMEEKLVESYAVLGRLDFRLKLYRDELNERFVQAIKSGDTGFSDELLAQLEEQGLISNPDDFRRQMIEVQREAREALHSNQERLVDKQLLHHLLQLTVNENPKDVTPTVMDDVPDQLDQIDAFLFGLNKAQVDSDIAGEMVSLLPESDAIALAYKALILQENSRPYAAQSLETGLKLLAKGGSQRAQRSLGLFYCAGIGVPKSQKIAVSWFRLAAAGIRGCPEAQYRMGISYFYGNGVDKDMKEAVKWFGQAARQGHAHAQFSMGFCYETYMGGQNHRQKAVGWYRLAARQGKASAQCNLARCYFFGQGVARNLRKAVRWFKFAADQGHAISMYNLGIVFEGHNRTQEAMEWYTKAAENGLEDGEAALLNVQEAVELIYDPSLFLEQQDQLLENKQKAWNIQRLFRCMLS